MDSVIQVSIKDLLIFSVPLTGLLLFLGWLFKVWIGARIDKSIQHEYDKKIEEYRFSQLQRQKAELIARFFAHWIKYRGKERQFLDEKSLIDYYEELNHMSLEISLWIKDTTLLKSIMERLQMKNGSKTVHELTGEVRKLILGLEDDFDFNNIVTWPSPEEAKELFKL